MPFGESLTHPEDASKIAKGFTNHEQTDPSGLIYMQARFYAPWFGRFLSPDPGNDQHFEFTQKWNIYSYVSNNPIMGVDLNGMDEKRAWAVFTVKGTPVSNSTPVGRQGNNLVVRMDTKRGEQNYSVPASSMQAVADFRAKGGSAQAVLTDGGKPVGEINGVNNTKSFRDAQISNGAAVERQRAAEATGEGTISYAKVSGAALLSGSYTWAENGKDYTSFGGGAGGGGTLKSPQIAPALGGSAVMGVVLGDAGKTNSGLDSALTRVTVNFNYLAGPGFGPVFGVAYSPGSNTTSLELGVGFGKPGPSVTVENGGEKKP